MKHLLFFLLGLSLLCMSCGDDDDATPTNDLIEAELHYDGLNFSAPLLPAGTHTAAVRFTQSELADYVGQSMDEVIFYIQQVPASTILSIREQGANNAPGNVIYSADIGNTVGQNGWNLHILPNPIEITNDPIWVCLEVEHNGELRSVGCDPGPAEVDGDWISSSTNNDTWETLRAFTDGQVDINWNIRARVSE